MPAPTVHRAVLPCAGRGTRMLPFTRLVPKELVPLGSRPAVFFVLDEAAAAGIDEVIVVTAPGKDLLRGALELEREAGAWPGVALRWAIQDEPTGLAAAVALCAPLIEDEPFALLLPDNVPLAPGYRLAPLLEAWQRLAGAPAGGGPQPAVVGVLELDATWSGLFGCSGRIEHRELDAELLAIDRLHDKLPGRLEIAAGERILRACGRYVFAAEVAALLDADRRGAAGEVDEVPTVQRLARAQRLFGIRLAMPIFDVGHPRGLLAASAHLARDPGSPR